MQILHYKPIKRWLKEKQKTHHFRHVPRFTPISSSPWATGPPASLLNMASWTWSRPRKPPGPRAHELPIFKQKPQVGFLLLQKEGLKIAYENVQMFKCALKKHWRLIEATQNPSCIFFSRRMIRHIAKKRGASQTSDHSETSSCSGDEFPETGSDFSAHLVIHKTTDPKPKTWILENDMFHPYTTPPKKKLALKKACCGKVFSLQDDLFQESWRSPADKQVQHMNQKNVSNVILVGKSKTTFQYISNFQAVCEFINTPLKNPSQFSSSWPQQRVLQKKKMVWNSTCPPFQAIYSHHILFVFSGRNNWKTAVFSLISHPHPQPNWEGSPPKLLES